MMRSLLRSVAVGFLAERLTMPLGFDFVLPFCTSTLIWCSAQTSSDKQLLWQTYLWPAPAQLGELANAFTFVVFVVILVVTTSATSACSKYDKRHKTLNCVGSQEKMPLRKGYLVIV